VSGTGAADPRPADAAPGRDGVALPSFGTYYDFRNPPRWHVPWDRFYAEIIEQVAWAETELGIRSAWISEHHFVDDGYTPSPLVLAGAIAMRTQHVEIGTSIAILPLQHPVRMAEDALTVDALSGGRFRLGVGVGYRPEEFAAFGVPMSARWSVMEQGLQILRAAFDGRPIDASRHPELAGVTVTPGPLEGGGPELWLGTFGPQGIDRAARYADGLLGPIPELWPVYADACARHGRTPRVAAGYHWIFGDDPERELHRVAPYVMHQVNEYGDRGAYGPGWSPVANTDELLARTPYELVDADEIARQIAVAARTGFVEDVHYWTRFPGEPIEWSNERLELFMRQVVPRVARHLAS
jgi:alkanesulfonate monooxygenase SsuD/methylene tetrahydromethanopterin reductase-like flavin-dependent oxidoreductase (luciferase family)